MSPISSVSSDVGSPRPILVAGRWKVTDQILVSVEAGSGDELGRTCLASASELEEATQAAVEAFPTLRKLASFERADILRRVADGMESRASELAELLAREAGKPHADARTEVARTASAFRLAAEEIPRFGGEVLPLDVLASSRGAWGITRRMPIGPVAAITPFNVPLNLTAHKLAPALAVGNPVVLKPDSRVALTVLCLTEILVEAGVPEGAFSVLPMEVEVADQLVTDERFRLLSFTGSAPVGWDMRARAGTKQVVLELGGDAAVIVHEDADVDDAVQRILKGAFKHAGQLCISVQHAHVHRSIFEQVVRSLAAGAAELRVGDAMTPDVEVGPMISTSSAQRTIAWIEEAVEAGATVHTGGGRDGPYVRPTVLTGASPATQVCTEEAFAPILVCHPYDRFEDALGRVNTSRYGLQTGVFTQDLGRIWTAFEELEVGGVVINNVPTFRVDHMPYGGVKDSGLGREGIRYAMEHMTEPRMLVVNPGT